MRDADCPWCGNPTLPPVGHTDTDLCGDCLKLDRLDLSGQDREWVIRELIETRVVADSLRASLAKARKAAA